MADAILHKSKITDCAISGTVHSTLKKKNNEAQN